MPGSDFFGHADQFAIVGFAAIVLLFARTAIDIYFSTRRDK